MHDEAAPTYVEMVENTARGHLFLKKNFGITPKGTWQVGFVTINYAIETNSTWKFDACFLVTPLTLHVPPVD
jgi:hypothetical protein